MTAAVFVPDTEGVQGSMYWELVSIKMLLPSFSESIHAPIIWLQFTPTTTALLDMLRVFALECTDDYKVQSLLYRRQQYDVYLAIIMKIVYFSNGK